MNYFSGKANDQKRRRKLSLEPGMLGFLCTTNFREKGCVRDAYKILNDFADEIYGQELAKEDKPGGKVQEEPVDEANKYNDDEDISTALNKEITELKAVSAKPVNARRFQEIDTGVKNVMFIKTTLPNPLELVTKIVTELDKTKKQRTRFLLRLLPIEVVCKAYMNDIKASAEKLFDKYFVETPRTFSIVFNRHSNNSVHRDEIIENLAHMVLAKNPKNKADLKNPEIAVVVEVIREVCLMSVAPHYYKYRKYNLVEICNVKEHPKDTNETTDKMKDSKSEEADKEQTTDREEAIDKMETTEKEEVIDKEGKITQEIKTTEDKGQTKPDVEEDNDPKKE